MFNVHNNLTADGVLITEGMKVVTNDCEQGTVVADSDDTEFGCCAPTDSHSDTARVSDYTLPQLHNSGQMVVDGIHFTDHENGYKCPESAGGIAPCRHNHWFRVATSNGTVSLDGERMGARSYGGVRVEGGR
jgi:hypothetical protein